MNLRRYRGGRGAGRPHRFGRYWTRGARRAHPRLTPATLELSGSDAVFVLPEADLALLTDALAFALRLNGGATCIARAASSRRRGRRLNSNVGSRRVLAGLPSVPVAKSTLQRLAPLLDEARRAGCRIMGAAPEADGFAMSPVLVTDATPELALLKADIFAPVLALVPARDCEEALRFDAMCPYALGASVFGPEQAARGLAARIRAGAVTVNDLIVPTADPRLPFGGRGQSGYGVTRGAEGLLELTCIKTISVRGGRLRPHHQSTTAVDEILFREYLRAAHGAGWVARIRACTSLLASLARRVRRARHLAGDTNGARGQSK